MTLAIKIGSRDSLLAKRQAELVMQAIRQQNPDAQFILLALKTTGDKILEKRLDAIGGKGLFVKELEQALLDGRIDIAVHSYKDVPYETTTSGELPIVALSDREAPFDALVLPAGQTELDPSKPVGSSSLRRSIQFQRLYPEIAVETIRGNVQTRLAKLDSGAFSAIILAQAGLLRLGLESRISHVFSLEEMIPSGSQGIIAVQGRSGEDYAYLECFHSPQSGLVSQAERQFLRALDGGCTSPVAVYGQLFGQELKLTGMYVDGLQRVAIGSLVGPAEQAGQLGESLARQLRVRLEGK